MPCSVTISVSVQNTGHRLERVRIRRFPEPLTGRDMYIRGLYQDVESDFTGPVRLRVRGAGASVSHLTVSGNIKLGGRVTYVAGIAGYVAGKNSDAKAQITDCHSKVSITVTGIRTLDAGVAGVAGYSTICKNHQLLK